MKVSQSLSDNRGFSLYYLLYIFLPCPAVWLETTLTVGVAVPHESFRR